MDPNNLFTWAGPLWSIQAYFDPGSGSIIIQLALAALLGLGFLIRAYWKKLVNFFRKLTGKKTIEPKAQETPEDDE